MDSDRTGQNGFTLIEVVLAISILAVGILGLAALQITAIKHNASGINRTEAIALIEDKIEDYMNTPYSSITEGTVSESSSLGIFARESVVQFYTPTNDSKTITVTVTWMDSKSHSISLRTVVSA